jgi:transposase
MIWIVGLLEYGLSSVSIAATLGVTDKTVRSFVYAVGERLGIVQDLCPFITVSEVDETYWGGRRKGKRGRGAAGKTPVFGIKERGGHSRLLVIPNVEGSTLRKEIRRRAAKGSWVVSDTFHSYDRLWQDGFNHAAINHDTAYALGDIHTQGIEGTWGHMQPKLKASHRQISPRHLQSYLDIFSWNFGREKPQDYLMATLEILLSSVPPTT